MDTSHASPSHGPQESPGHSPEAGNDLVIQPTKLTEMVELINLVGTINERVTEQHSRYAGAAGNGQQGQGSSATGTSQRDHALANLPAPAIMQRKLISHIDGEIKELHKLAKSVSTQRKKGWAYELNEIYSRMRRLSSLAAEIMHASIEVVQRFYVLVFIDRQPLVRSVRAAPQPA